MGNQFTIIKILFLLAISVSSFITFFIGFSALPNKFSSSSSSLLPAVVVRMNNYSKNLSSYIGNNLIKHHHHLLLLVPFRNRFEELVTFGPFIHNYLNHKNISHHILILNQIDDLRFNRAALINVGFDYIKRIEWNIHPDYIVIHDVDLLPLNPNLPYEYPGNNSVMHVAAPGLHPKYSYPTFMGGILVVPMSVFQNVNGMSNIYWGWGLEDDEFYVRLKQAKIKLLRPTGIQTGRNATFRHVHSPQKRPRDHRKCFNQFNRTRRRDRLTGLHNINYTLTSVTEMTIDNTPLILLSVQLHCNRDISPWCDCSTQTIRTTHNNSHKNTISNKESELKKQT